MKPREYRLYCWLGLLLLVLPFAQAQDPANPYQTIVERNTFALKPPPPPPSNEPPTPPPAPLAKVVLTGITSLFGPSSKRALLEIEEQEPGKPGKTTKKPILKEGERDGSVEVISIDVEKNIVKIKNGTLETNLTFAVVQIPATPPAPLPGASPIPNFPGMRVPTPAIPGASMNPAVSSGPTIIPIPGRSTPSAGAYPGTTPGTYSPTPGAYTPSSPGGVSTTITPSTGRNPFTTRGTYSVPPTPGVYK